MKPLTTNQVAQLFYVTAQTVINWSNAGKIKYSRLGSSPRKFLIEDIREFMQGHKLDSKYLNFALLKKHGLM
jgi:predicted site-specific integrase-resolvase